MKRRCGILLIATSLLTGCWSLPDGTPPPGAITAPESAPERYDRRQAFNYFITALLPVLTAQEPRPALWPEGPEAAALVTALTPLTGCRSALAPDGAARLLSERTADCWSITLSLSGNILFRQTLPLR